MSRSPGRGRRGRDAGRGAGVCRQRAGAARLSRPPGVRSPGSTSLAVGADGHPDVLRHLRQSFAAARHDTPIFLTIVMAAMFCFGFFGATLVAIPALAKLSLNAGDAGVGILLGARGVGALVGGIVAGSIAIRRMGLV